ncbi:hypothetical protein, partial [Pantoea rodasii]|uniref:hypothetical protein n=1 Tax=Pantoea rodasii TaxID=1076549 RepID=UPI001E30F3C3
PYTHFPGVLLQPLGHLTTFFPLTALGQRGATIGSNPKTVKPYFLLFFYSLKLCAACCNSQRSGVSVIKLFLIRHKSVTELSQTCLRKHLVIFTDKDADK